jgi:hypothetical protein
LLGCYLRLDHVDLLLGCYSLALDFLHKLILLALAGTMMHPASSVSREMQSPF